MSRSGYSDDLDDQWQFIRWRGAVKSAIRGKRGQEFLSEMLTALDGLPEPKLTAMQLEANGEVCAIGSVGRARGIDMGKLDPEDYSGVAHAFGISDALAQEIVYLNDEAGRHDEDPEQRFSRMRRWVERHINKPVQP